MNDTKHVPTLGSLFDGSGGFPMAVTGRRFPDMLQVGDITKLNGAGLPPVDIVCGGSPCQDLSVAGARAGLSGERSGLFMEQIRITKELRDADLLRGRTGQFVRPRLFCWENVPGAFSSGKPQGEDFRIVLEETLGICLPGIHVPGPLFGRFKSSGWIRVGDTLSLGWRVLDAQYWGVPQRRRRILRILSRYNCAQDFLLHFYKKNPLAIIA